jgi:hypothetical protein
MLPTLLSVRAASDDLTTLFCCQLICHVYGEQVGVGVGVLQVTGAVLTPSTIYGFAFHPSHDASWRSLAC